MMTVTVKVVNTHDQSSSPYFLSCSWFCLFTQTWAGHGVNGLGDAIFRDSASGLHDSAATYALKVAAALSPIPAVQALHELSLRYPGEIDLIALGPLTNLALGVRLYDGFAAKFKSLTIMGGSVWGR